MTKTNAILGLVIFLGVCKLTESFHKSFCTRLGIGQNEGDPLEDPTVGGSHILFQKFNNRFDTNLENIPAGYRVKVRGITVRNDADGEVALNGYLHLILTVGSKTNNMGLLIHAENKNSTGGNSLGGLGEFISDFPYDSCPDVKEDADKGDFVKPNKHQFVLCNGISKAEPLPTNVFVYNPTAGSAYNSPSVPPKVFHLFWRFSNYYCNHLHTLFFRVSVLRDLLNTTDEGFYTAPNYIHLSNNLTGAPDPLPLGNEIMKCDVDLNRQDLFPWVGSYEEKEDDVDVTDPKIAESCRGSYNISQANYSVRCDEVGHECLPQAAESFPGLLEYEDYVETLWQRKNEVCKCPTLKTPMEPPLLLLPSKIRTTTTTTESPATIDDKNRVKAEIEFNRLHGIYVDQFPGSVIWNYRIIHGVAGIIATIFVTPVSNFMARYYKETFMNYEIMFNRVWYMVHLIAVLVNLQLHFYGGYSITQAKKLLGLSKSDIASAHRIVGWISLGLYLAMTLLGGIRPWSDKARRIVIALHWGLGMVYYFLCLTAAFLSVYIHGSPSATSDMTVEETGRQWILALMGIWILVDIACHIAMTMHACHMDSLMELKREYLPGPIPLVDEDDEEDAPGYEFRKRILMFYVGVSFMLTTTICVWMLFMPQLGRGFGVMTCSHDDSNQLMQLGEACRI